jgi:hypothetical protein
MMEVSSDGGLSAGMGRGGSPKGAAMAMGVPIGLASGRGVGVDFCLQQTEQSASKATIKMTGQERIKESFRRG